MTMMKVKMDGYMYDDGGNGGKDDDIDDDMRLVCNNILRTTMTMILMVN